VREVTLARGVEERGHIGPNGVFAGGNGGAWRNRWRFRGAILGHGFWNLSLKLCFRLRREWEMF